MAQLQSTTITGTLTLPGYSSGFVKIGAGGAVTMDTNTYITGVTSGMVTTALGYTPVTTARTLTINGTSYDLSADRSWTIAAGVTSVNAGSGISVNATTGAVTVTNTGVLSVNGSTGAVTGILTTSNYNSYSPTLTGGGASGTWSINVTGSAGSVDFNNLTNKTGGTGTYQTSGDFRAPIFYDSNDTSYYLDPNSTGTSLYVAGSVRGTYYVASNYSSTGYTQYKGYDNNNHFIMVRGRVTGTTSSPTYTGYHRTSLVEYAEANDDTGWFFQTAATGNYDIVARITRSYSQFEGSVRAPIFYDSNDTGYYGDFASTSRMNSIVYDNLKWAGDQNYGLLGRNGYLDTVNGIGSDPLELNYYSGGSVIIGTGVNGSKNLYAAELYDSGSRVWTASSAPRAGNSLLMYYQGFTLDANTMDGNSSGFTYSNNAPFTGPVIRISETGYSLWFNAAYAGGGTQLAFRTRNGDSATLNPWRTILHDANYNSYSPTLTGGGASGTWSINITGSAGSASTASQVTINYNNDSNSTYQLLWGSGNSVYGTSQVYVNPSSDIIYARGGYISPGNPWGTADSAFFPNGITTAGSTNWVYGRTYIGNAPGNGSGVDISSVGSSYFLSGNTSGTWGYAGQFVDRNNAANNYIPWSFESEYGNHSWGIVARFHIQQSGADKPAIQFTATGSNERWSLGYCTGSDYNFRITQNQAYRTDNSGQDGWGTERFRINTDGTTLLGIQGSNTNVYGLLRLASNNNLYLDNNYGQSIIGLYSASRYQGVFAMGDAYKLPIDGTGPGNLYGLAWSHPNAGGVAGNLNTHGLLVMENGTFLAAVSGSIRARDDMRAPIFYDSDDTSYYLDLNSTSNSAMRIRGGALFGPNTTWGAYLRIGSNGNTDYSHASVVTTNGNLHLDAASGKEMYLNYYVNGTIWLNSSGYYISSNGSYYNGTAASAGNADTVDGYHASTSTIGNYIVVRDGNGYIFGNYINMTDDGNPGGGTSISSFITKQGDNYYRSVSPTNAMASIRGVASGSWGINITGSAGSVPFNNLTSKTSGTGTYQTSGDFRAPVFYDSDNTNYYLDPNATSSLVGIQLNGGAGFAGIRLGVNGAIYSNSTIYAEGDIIAYYSDERLKTKTGIIENAVDKIKQLHGFYYKNNDLAKSFGYVEEKMQVGLSAQEVKNILPEVVTLAPFDTEVDEETGLKISKSGDDYLTVDYTKLVPLLVEAIKEQQKEIEELKAKVK